MSSHSVTAPIFELVRSERFELSRITPLPPEDSASASSATTAYVVTTTRNKKWNGAAGET